MGRTERTLRDEPGCGVEDPGDGVNLCGLERFFKGKRREDGGQAFGEHRLARARRANHEDVVAAGGRDLESALRGLLTADIFEVDGEVLQFAEELFRLDLEGLALNLSHDGGVE